MKGIQQIPLKFNAWDRQKNKILLAEELSGGLIGIDPGGFGFCYFHNTEKGFVIIKNLIPLQYTGINDKENQEIYEKDIVKLGETIYIVIKDKDARFSLYDLETYKLVLSHPNPEFDSYNMLSQINYKKLGNIYENPKLFK